MIGQKNRFHGHNSLSYVYSKGRTLRGPGFAIKYADNPRRKNYRCAVVVSKKVSKSAVTRNRIRRRFYELVRDVEGQLIGNPDIVVTVYAENIATIDFEELKKSFLQVMLQTEMLGKREEV